MPSHRHALITGTLFAAAAGLMWGLVFIAPLLLPQYPPALLTFGRYLAFGLIALPLAWLDRERLRQLTRADWLEALKLAAVGNVAYYLFLSAAIQRTGAPLPTMLIGTLPVVIAVVANRRNRVRDGRLPWRHLLPSLVLMLAGIALVNQAEWAHFNAQLDGAAPGQASAATGAAANTALWKYASGAALAVGAVICWTWYPLRNADWLRLHEGRSATTWATAQGVATLPLALLGYAGWWAYTVVVGGSTTADGTPFVMPLGPEPLRYVFLMVSIGLLASWLGTLCWNEASQRLPTSLAGPLIVFETLAALAYAWMLRAQWPQASVLLGVALLVAGVVWALARKPQKAAAP
jgi:drug/metabolite transporter (DMT)-like permease